MARHDFRYFFKEGLSNMFSHGFMTFATIGITVACLLIMGTFTLVAVNADANLKDLEAENQILAYVDENYTASQTTALKEKLEAIPNVSSAEHISREQAMAEFVARYPDEQLFQGLDPEILRDRYIIKIQNLELQRETVQALRNTAGIADVNSYEAVADGFIAIRNVATMVCVTLIVILFVVSVFITSNTIRLTTFDRREEIAIMRMVGATNGFIRWPFVYEGFLMGVLSAGIAYFCQWGLYSAMVTGITKNDTLQLISVLPFEQMRTAVAIAFGAAGLLMGVGGSLSAIRKFLRV